MMNEILVMDHDLDAYIDNQLDERGRMRVENYLANHPAAAARVMSDLSVRHGLRLALEEQDVAFRPRTRHAARRLETGLSRRRVWTNLKRIAAVGILVTTGWVAHTQFGSFGFTTVNASIQPPSYVEEAVRAHRTTLVRERMPSQVETGKYDPEDIRSATAIVMPVIPSNWRVMDVQVYPSQFGPSVEMSLAEKDGAHLSLFAVRPGFFAVEPLRTLHLADAQAVYWQIGEVAYALVSNTPNRNLSSEAELLVKTLY
ncbi:MAG: Fis family transcriptional regulator [Rhizobium sp.]|nr:Fis family transcriptional regulator [Rhizobium sp.]